jgi:hypothetical protein
MCMVLVMKTTLLFSQKLLVWRMIAELMLNCCTVLFK